MRREFVKTLILTSLILSSIFLSYIITSYRPNYDRTFEIQSNQNDAILEKNKLNSLNLLSPDLIVKRRQGSAEEDASAGVITKISNVAAIKQKSDIKTILEVISNKEIDLVRIRDEKADELVKGSREYLVMTYSAVIDSVASKFIYLLNENINTSINFDRVLLADANKNTLYLYTEGKDEYMQIVFKEDIFTAVNESFSEKARLFGRYAVGDSGREFYVEENLNEYTIDTYKAEALDIKDMFANISDRNSMSKISNIDDQNREITDGYSMLRENTELIDYIDPANIKDTEFLDAVEANTRSANYLINTFVPNQEYGLGRSVDNVVNYTESYKGATVYSDRQIDDIKVELARQGVHKISYPRYIRGERISSQRRPIYHMDNLDAILNYLYAEAELEKLESVDVVYKKIFNQEEKTLRYEPTWHIKYDGGVYSFSEIKEKLGRG